MRASLRFLVNFFIIGAAGSVSLCGQDLPKQSLVLEANSPKGVALSGAFKQALRWTDRNGENLVVLSESGIKENKKQPEYRDAEIFACHFALKGQKPQQTWRVYDFSKDCPLDVEARFLNKGLRVTELSGDGVGEVWLVYKIACRGDVSPAAMKIIMYEGKKKFAMRGRNKVQTAENQFEGGEFEFDEAFKNAPQSIRDYAKKLWEENVTETFGE
jgi:hypothetical protein